MEEFAKEIFRWLRMPFEERISNANQTESVNYLGTAAGLVVAVSTNPKRDYLVGRSLESYPFLISIAPEGTKQAGDYLFEHAGILAWRLSRDGYSCFVPNDWTAVKETQGRVYDASE